MKRFILCFSIIISLMGSMNTYSQSVQCKGITKEGNQCKRKTTNENGYCSQHQSQSVDKNKPAPKQPTGDKIEPTPAKTDVKAKDQQKSPSKEYYNGHEVKTGPRGGRYYINKNGNKTYLKKK